MEITLSVKSEISTPKRNLISQRLENSPSTEGHWNWTEGVRDENFSSPISVHSSPETPQDYLKRGRPRADSINNLIIEGTSSPSSIRCKICSRVFPREKSLQAHLRTHTGKYHN